MLEPQAPRRTESASRSTDAVAFWNQHAPDIATREAEARLLAPGCPTCRAVAEAERLYFFWFVNEAHTEPGVLADLGRARGFCPAHTRRFLATVRSGAVPTVVYAAVVDAARRGSSDGAPPATCPACEASARAVEATGISIAEGLGDPRFVSRYNDHGGLCLEHAVSTLRTVDVPEIALRILGPLTETLDRLGRAQAADPLVSLGDDAAVRARLRAKLPDTAAGRTTTERLHALLDAEACPVCALVGSMERRYLQWAVLEARDASSSFPSEAAELCERHVRDLATVDRDTATLVLQLIAVARRHELRRASAILRDLSMERRRRNRRDPRVRDVLKPALRRRDCPACRALATTRFQTRALVAAAVADEATRRRYVESHGLCVHDVAATSGASRRIFVAVAAARLELVAWELGEARRKRGWDARHEEKGPERDAFLRAPLQLDGRVLLGGSAALAPLLAVEGTWPV